MSDRIEDLDLSKEEIITPLEFVQRQRDQEAEALALYPGNFNKCTYLEGPLNQPVYVCITCKENPERSDTGPAGICYSCSISCHSEHELLELFNKRNYTCECGTKKFPFKCSLEKGIKVSSSCQSVEQLIDNEGWRKTVLTNKYTQNHDGLYCWCHKKYDPETEEDEMIQCLDCQEWYHRTCIGVNEIDEGKPEFICSTCVSSHPILRAYSKNEAFTPVIRPELPKAVDPNLPIAAPLSTTTSEVKNCSGSSKDSSLKRNLEEAQILPPVSTGLATNENTPRSRKLLKQSNVDVDNSICHKPSTHSLHESSNISMFAKKDWINDICRCEKCEDEYYEQNMEHLLVEEEIYTPEADTEPALSLHDAGLAALSKLPHENAIELATRMELIRTKLRDYLAPFAASGKVITKEDIEAFFQNVKPQ